MRHSLVADPQHTIDAAGHCPRTALCARQAAHIVRVEVDQEFAGQVAVGQRGGSGRCDQHGANLAGPADPRGRVVRARRRIVSDTPVFLDVRTLECIVHLDPEPQPPPLVGQRLRVKFFPQ